MLTIKPKALVLPAIAGVKLSTIAATLLLLTSTNLHAQVQELNNTEMTEAFIQDNSIIVKQRNVKPKPTEKKQAIKIGPGTPVVSQADEVRELNQQDESQYRTLEQDMASNNSIEQLTRFNQQQSSQIAIPVMDSIAAQQQQAYAHDLVRNGLGLSSDTTITTDLMVQYLASFAGQSVGNPTGPQQSITANGIQISIPNTNPNLDLGVYPSGDGNHNVDVNNAQIIWNLIFPQGQQP